MLPQGKYDMSEVEEMTYYDLKTNEIWAESNIDGFHDEHIEIDELIAPLIRELNIKGYKTKFCCSGHPFYSLCEAMVDSEETAKAFVGLIGTERTENPRVPVRALYVMPDNDFYITFEENEQKAIVLALPDGFEWDDLQFENAFTLVTICLESCCIPGVLIKKDPLVGLSNSVILTSLSS